MIWTERFLFGQGKAYVPLSCQKESVQTCFVQIHSVLFFFFFLSPVCFSNLISESWLSTLFSIVRSQNHLNIHHHLSSQLLPKRTQCSIRRVGWLSGDPFCHSVSSGLGLSERRTLTFSSWFLVQHHCLRLIDWLFRRPLWCTRPSANRLNGVSVLGLIATQVVSWRPELWDKE